MSVKEYPSINLIRQCLRYDDGKLFWHERPRDHFSDDAHWRTWNKRFSGKEAGYKSLFKKHERWIVHVYRQKLFRYHVVWAMHHGEWALLIDHENRNSLDDRIDNLRPATTAQNTANSRLSRRNRSGFKGVGRGKNPKKWAARIIVNRKNVFLGHFDDPEEAHAAYCAAARKYFGEFACDGKESIT